MWNQSGNLIFDASIKDDNGSEEIRGGFKSDIIKIFDMTFDISKA